MKNIYFLIAGAASFLVSFFAHRYFIQFTSLGILLLVFYMVNKNTCEVEELKKTIEKHNELMQQDIDLLKKDR